MDEEDNPSTSGNKPKMERCLFGKLEVVVPESLIEDVCNHMCSNSIIISNLHECFISME